MKYAIDMGSGAMIYIPSFMKIGPGVQKLLKRDTQTHRQHDDLISILVFLFQNNECNLKININGSGLQLNITVG
jgi:hypothetical protein